MRKHLRTAVTVAVALASFGCSGIIDGPHGSHPPGCTYSHNTLWQQNINFTINHSDPRTCPAALPGGGVPQYGAALSSSAVIFDNTVTYPNDANTSSLAIGAYDGASAFPQQCIGLLGDPPGGGITNPITAYFYWGQPPQGQNGYSWRAEGTITFTRLETPDYLCFTVELDSSPIDPARARIMVNYYGEQL